MSWAKNAVQLVIFVGHPHLPTWPGGIFPQLVAFLSFQSHKFWFEAEISDSLPGGFFLASGFSRYNIII